MMQQMQSQFGAYYQCVSRQHHQCQRMLGHQEAALADMHRLRDDNSTLHMRLRRVEEVMLKVDAQLRAVQTRSLQRQ